MLNDLTSDDDPPVTSKDIDICHQLPLSRKDNKRVVVCYFVRCTTKALALQAKKTKCDYKFKGNNIFINDHLTPENKNKFEQARACM